MSEIAAGQKWVKKNNSQGVIKAEIIAVHSDDDTDYVVFSRSCTIGGTELNMLTRAAFRYYYERADDFFKIGVQYRLIGELNGYIYSVEEVRTLENPIFPIDRRVAIALRASPNGKGKLVLLNGNDFERLEEAE